MTRIRVAYENTDDKRIELRHRQGGNLDLLFRKGQEIEEISVLRMPIYMPNGEKVTAEFEVQNGAWFKDRLESLFGDRVKVEFV